MQHPDVNKVTFTGSPNVGRGILQGAASNFKRVTLELGGKSANIIFADANLDRASRNASSGIFFNAGQVCSAGSRVLVERSAYDEVIDRLVARAKTIKVGSPEAPDTTMGPVVSAGQMKTVLNYIDIGRSEGASAVIGGARIGQKGYYIQPTIFANVAHEMRVSQEEIFGPVLSVIPFDDEQDALRIANGTAYSLAAGVWSADIGRVHRMAAGSGPALCGSTLTVIRTCGCLGVARVSRGLGASMVRLRWRISLSRRRCGWRLINRGRSPRGAVDEDLRVRCWRDRRVSGRPVSFGWTRCVRGDTGASSARHPEEWTQARTSGAGEGCPRGGLRRSQCLRCSGCRDLRVEVTSGLRRRHRCLHRCWGSRHPWSLP